MTNQVECDATAVAPLKAWLLLGLISVTFVGSAGVALLSISLWPMLFVVASSLLVTLAQRISWTMSAAATVLLLLFGQAILMPLFPLTGLSLTANNVVALSLLESILIGHLWWTRDALRPLARRSVWVLVSATVVPFLALAISVASVVRYGASKISWAMANDAVWNTMSSRFISADNGLLASVHPNPSPLANEVMASILAVGRSAIPSAELLEHDISREIQVLIVVTAVTSFLASLSVSRVLTAKRPILRLILTVSVGLMPWTWFMGGYAFRFGFYNVSLASLALVALWLIWLESERSPRLGIPLLFTSATVFLAIWAPLVLVPGALALAAIVWRRNALKQPGKRLLLVGGLSVLQLLVYAFFVTLPDLRRDGKALADNGAMIDISTYDVIAIVAVLFLIASLGVHGRESKWEFGGVVVAILAGAIGVAYLIYQRLGINEPWGYYPAKLGWFIAILAAFVVAASMARHVEGGRGRPGATIGRSLAAALAVVAILIQVPPSGWGIFSVFPALSITRAAGMSAMDAEAQDLFNFSDPAEKTMVVRYFPTPAQDLFVNGWLLQQPAEASSDPLRNYAYLLDTSSSSNVCEALTTWGNGVVVKTRDPALESELLSICPSTTFQVDLVP